MTNSLQTITNQIYCNFLYLCIGLDSPAALTQEQADLGGVFTGVGAEAFVGGFTLPDLFAIFHYHRWFSRIGRARNWQEIAVADHAMKIAQQQLRQIYPKPMGCSGGLVFLGLERLSVWSLRR